MVGEALSKAIKNSRLVGGGGPSARERRGEEAGESCQREGSKEDRWKRMSKATSRFGDWTANTAGRKGKKNNKVDEVVRSW